VPKHCPGLKFANWPEADRIAWTAAVAKGDRFRRGPAAHWSPSTRCDVEKTLCRWLGYLAAFERAALTEHPVARLTEDRLVGYVGHLAETVQSVGRCIYLAHLLMAFRVMFPGEPPQILKSVAAQLKSQSQARPKAWVVTPHLIALGEKLMEEEAGHKGSKLSNVHYRDGLMLMLWPSRPLRLRAFAQIQIGKHLCKVGEEWRLIFEGTEMKSGRPYQVTLPRQVIPFLEQYIAEVRPSFPGAKQHDALWIGARGGGPLAPGSISRLIGNRTEAEFGDRICPHRLRHCAASTIAVFAPSEIGTAVGLLDHSSPRITYKHYILARGIEASRQYAKIVADQTPRGAGRSRRPQG
jgi:integrase/recombinase XerD